MMSYNCGKKKAIEATSMRKSEKDQQLYRFMMVVPLRSHCIKQEVSLRLLGHVLETQGRCEH